MKIKIFLFAILSLLHLSGYCRQPNELPRFFFQKNSSTLDFEKDSINFNNLQSLKSFLKDYPNLFIEIYGHSSSDEGVKNDTLLSYKRAQSLKEILIKQGHESCRIKIRGYGAKYPTTRDTKSDKNRRVETKVSRGKLINQQIFGEEEPSILYKGCLDTKLDLTELDKIFSRLNTYINNNEQEDLLITIYLPHSFESLKRYYTCDSSYKDLKANEKLKKTIEILNKRKEFLQEYLNQKGIKFKYSVNAFPGLLNSFSIKVLSIEC